MPAPARRQVRRGARSRQSGSRSPIRITSRNAVFSRVNLLPSNSVVAPAIVNLIDRRVLGRAAGMHVCARNDFIRRSGYWAAPGFSCLFLHESNAMTHSSRRFRQTSRPHCLYHCCDDDTFRQARLYTRRLRNTQRLQSRPAAAPTDREVGRGTGEDTTLATPGALALRRLANRIAAYAPHDGAFQLRLPGTYAIRLSRMTTEAPTPLWAPPCASRRRAPRS